MGTSKIHFPGESTRKGQAVGYPAATQRPYRSRRRVLVRSSPIYKICLVAHCAAPYVSSRKSEFLEAP
jgi:hypothetical protein